jgi:hypothetical protein
MRRTPNDFDANFGLQVFNLPQSRPFYLLKTSPQQVAERTLQGILEGTDHVHADIRAEELWRALKTDTGQIAQQMQQLWDTASVQKR